MHPAFVWPCDAPKKLVIAAFVQQGWVYINEKSKQTKHQLEKRNQNNSHSNRAISDNKSCNGGIHYTNVRPKLEDGIENARTTANTQACTGTCITGLSTDDLFYRAFMSASLNAITLSALDAYMRSCMLILISEHGVLHEFVRTCMHTHAWEMLSLWLCWRAREHMLHEESMPASMCVCAYNYDHAYKPSININTNRHRHDKTHIHIHIPIPIRRHRQRHRHRQTCICIYICIHT